MQRRAGPWMTAAYQKEMAHWLSDIDKACNYYLWDWMTQVTKPHAPEEAGQPEVHSGFMSSICVKGYACSCKWKEFFLIDLLYW